MLKPLKDCHAELQLWPAHRIKESSFIRRFVLFLCQTSPSQSHRSAGQLSSKVTEYMLQVCPVSFPSSSLSDAGTQEIFAVTGPVLGVKIIPDKNFQHGGQNYGFVGVPSWKGLRILKLRRLNTTRSKLPKTLFKL
jgi:hypothetical protein